MKKIFIAVLIAISANALEITKQEAATIGAVVGAGAGMIVGEYIQPYAGQHTKTISTVVSAGVGAYVGHSLGANPKTKSEKGGKIK